MTIALLLGCSADLLPGESVLGVDVPMSVVLGEDGSELGSIVAWNGAAWAAAAPGAGEIWVDGEASGGDEPFAWVGWWGDRLARGGQAGVGVEGSDLPLLPGSLFAASAGGVFAWSDDEIRAWEGASAVLTGVVALAADESRVAARVCEDECSVTSASLDLVEWQRASFSGESTIGGLGGAVAFDNGAICVGDPELDLPDGAGSVSCDDGRLIEGETGDHLGQAIGGGFAAGTFNKWIVPPRARLVPLSGGEVLTLEVGAENQPIRLAGDDATLIVGSPFHPQDGLPAGAIFVVTHP